MKTNNSQLSILNSPLILITLLFCSANLHAKYVDYRNRKADSLEQVLATKSLPDFELSKLYGQLSWAYLNTDPKKTMDYSQKRIALAQKRGYAKQLTLGYIFLAELFPDFNQYDSARFYYDKALEAAASVKTAKNTNGKPYTEEEIEELYSEIYGGMGDLYNKEGKNLEAIAYYQKAMKIFEKYDYKESQSIAFNNIGELYLSMENYEQAEINFNKLDSLAHITNDSLFIVIAKSGLSRILLHHKAYDKALQNADIAYNYFFTHPEEVSNKVKTLNLLAEIYMEGYNDNQQAEEYLLQALQMANNKGDVEPTDKSQTLALLSTIYLKRGEWRKAEQTALKALVTKDIELSNTSSVYKNLSKAYAHLGNVAKADEYFDKYDSLKSVWSNKDYQSAIKEMEVKYDTEKKELEIQNQQNIIKKQNLQRGLLAGGVAVSIVILALLWYMLRLRDRRNRTLAEMNATKDKFFSIISHDLKNPAVAQRDALQALIKNAGSWDAGTLTDYYHELLKSAEGQVELLYNLLNWAQIQTGRMAYAPARFALSRILFDTDLIRNMAKSKGITLILPESQETLISGDRNMLSTVIRNLLTNAVKFTPSGGTVTLEVSPHPRPLSTRRGEYSSPSEGLGVACISVTDTGTGMSEEQIRNMFQLDNKYFRRGTAGEQGSGLGLIVCKELLEKHGSELHVESEEGKGSRFWFIISV